MSVKNSAQDSPFSERWETVWFLPSKWPLKMPAAGKARSCNERSEESWMDLF